MSLIRLQPRTWLRYPGTPLWGNLSQVPLWITVLALPCLVPPVLLHPRLELMQERWPAGSQQLVVTPNTQLEVGDKTAGGCISGWELILSSLYQRREVTTLMPLGKQLLKTSRAAQRRSRLRAFRGRSHISPL